MQSKAKTPDEYYQSLPEDRKKAMTQLREILRENLPSGFEETMTYGMPGFVVPHSLYPDGYHVNPKDPLPFISLASQKNFIALYHMGIYSSPELLTWFQTEYKNQVPTKLDMGKSCIRLKSQKNIPYELIAELASKMTVEEWVQLYEKGLKS
ncbi:DUF1801 domain-containing protein [Marivirga sp. S37H4]|uniref:DUF1801 domain-containing protein n=1 Tax=Marivirga aurantiaca TaxID=2802615 RepID=A0A935CB08_9BACT|nr:DUF1801 domain-containing protein [Marivirga aurantiaca]MBK6266829.1 DUF1801 domain-containing protein [Marivirga aurantiaca]